MSQSRNTAGLKADIGAIRINGLDTWDPVGKSAEIFRIVAIVRKFRKI
jgi:hypothetical protein